jgi:hypothetical protein
VPIKANRLAGEGPGQHSGQLVEQCSAGEQLGAWVLPDGFAQAVRHAAP